MIRAALTLAVVFALLLIAARAAQAQTEIVLYNFTGGTDGGYPMSRLTADGAGNFYGTTDIGGLGYGTVFKLSPNGSGGWDETVLYSFTGGADGGNPAYSDVIFDSVGNLYGTASSGGAYGYGVAFELSPVGTSWTETILYTFANGADGGSPQTGMIFDPAGNLYGTNDTGVFELSPSNGDWTEQVLYNVYSPQNDALTMDAAGNIFGEGNETVYELSPNGNGSWSPSVIYTFVCSPELQCPKGEWPFGILVLDKAGNLYGTTYQGGGPNDCGGDYGCGNVYELIPGNGTWTERELHYFWGGPNDGYHPFGWIALDAAGNIYGTTRFGGYPGLGCKECGWGTVFELEAPVGTGEYKEKVLQNFDGANGMYPVSGVILDNAGNLYSTSQYGGQYSMGLVYEVTSPPVKTKSTLTSLPNPSMYGQAVTFTAMVTSSAGAPPDRETVTFMKGITLLGTGTLSGGSASFTTSPLPAGTYYIKAVYGGDSKFGSSTSNTVKQVVEKYPTTTTLSSSLNPSNYGQAVTLTATVTSTGPAPSGTVTFKSGSVILGSGTLNASGVLTLTTKKIPVGANSLTSTYNGDAFNGKSVSAAITQTVSQASINMLLTSTPNPSVFGKSVKFMAKLTSNGGLPTWQPVTFSYNGATLGTANVNSTGVATFSTTALPRGSDTVTAAYAGNVDYSSASATVTQLVN